MTTDNPHLETIIISTEERGRGVDEDPFRRVTRFHTTKGELLAERDEWMEQHLAREVVEHAARGKDIERLRRIFDEAQADCAKQIHRVHHLEQCIKNYQARLKPKRRKAVKEVE